MNSLEDVEERPPDLLIRSLAWLVRKIGKGTLLAWVLLLVALSSLVLGLATVMSGLDTSLLVSASLASALVAWVVARSRLSTRLAAVALLVYGVSGVYLYVGSLDDQVLAVLQSSNALALGWLHWRPLLPLPDAVPALAAYAHLGASLTNLTTRLVSWGLALLKGKAGFDPVSTALLWSLLIWLVSAWAAWAIRRLNQPLWGLTPGLALLAAVLAYGRGQSALLGPSVLALFLLMAFLHYRSQEQRWETQGVDYSEEVRFDQGVVAVLLALGLTALAVLAPNFSLRALNQYLDQYRRPPVESAGQGGVPLGESLGLKAPPPPTRAPSPLEKQQYGGLPREHLLGSGPELSERVVFTVQTGDFPPGPPEAVIQGPLPHYYWRSLSYDVYTGRGWTTTNPQAINYPAGWEASPALFPTQHTVRASVQMVEDLGSFIFAPGELMSANQDFQAAWRTQPDPQAVQASLAQGDLFGATTQASAYETLSRVPGASEAQLKRAGQDYPQWVLARYLALPDRVPARVLALARDLTATPATPYERAKAIESYLRTFPYTLDLSAPPGDRDVVDYFLFEVKAGYCDYYASAMVVLARAAGLPARLVMGYASGAYDAYGARWVVTEADAHSWPEIYFPGYGWVEFEPTAGRPPFDQSGTALSTPAAPLPAANPPAPFTAWLRPLAQAGVYVALLGALGLALYLLGQLADTWLLHQQAPGAAVETLFRRLVRLGHNLRAPLQPGDTPAEIAAILAGQVVRLAPRTPRGKAWLNAAGPELRQIAGLYAQAIYSPHPLDAVQQRQAIRAWRGLRWRLRWLILTHL